MKKFLLKSSFFILPILVLIIGIELYFRNEPNAFIEKASYLKQNKDKIEVLILGSSHHQNGLNPIYFSKKTCNLANGSQDIKMDSALFFSNVKQMKHLKAVVFEMDYHRMDIENISDFYRQPWYYIYYGIDYTSINWFKKISLYASNPSFFNDNLIQRFKKSYKPQVINEYGFVDKNFDSEFANMKYDSVTIWNSSNTRLKSRHKEISDVNFKANASRIESMIAYCKKNDIELYFLTSPLYATYLQHENQIKKQKVVTFINYLKNKYTIDYYNFESKLPFVLKDFKDDDHLTPTAAEKYSLLINDIINHK